MCLRLCVSQRPNKAVPPDMIFWIKKYDKLETVIFTSQMDDIQINDSKLLELLKVRKMFHAEWCISCYLHNFDID